MIWCRTLTSVSQGSTLEQGLKTHTTNNRTQTEFILNIYNQVFRSPPPLTGGCLSFDCLLQQPVLSAEMGSDSIRAAADGRLRTFGNNFTSKSKTCGVRRKRADDPHAKIAAFPNTYRSLRLCPLNLSLDLSFAGRDASAQLRADPSSASRRVQPHARGGGGAEPAEERVWPISGRLTQPIKGEEDAVLFNWD